MARAKTDKKLVSFVKGALVNKLVRDRAEIENRSESAIMEEVLLDGMLPENKEARFVVENYLYNEDGNIGEALTVLFGNNSAGIKWNAVHDNFFPLVKYAKNQETFCNTILSGEEKELCHTCSQIKSVIEKLEGLGKENVYYQREAEWGKTLLEELETKPESSRLINFYQLLLSSWEEFKNWSITYRLLADLAKLEKSWRDEAEARVELLNIIKIVSAEW